MMRVFVQDKAISRHFKSCVSAAEAAVAGKEGALVVSAGETCRVGRL
jgi:hypothetical protein